jgi:hypothetical protein
MSHARNNAAAPLVSVYDGRECIGFVLGRGRTGFEAFSRSEISLGMFKTQAAAANTVFNATKGEGHAK